MQQFTVPQFIDVEDKIIGPITTRQFLIMMAGFGIIVVEYKIFHFTPFLIVGLLTFALFGIVAFVKINGMPFHFFILNLLQTVKKPMLRVWNNYVYQPGYIDENKKNLAEERPTVLAKRFSTSRLAELSLIVDTQGAYRGENGKGTVQSLKTGGGRLEELNLPDSV